MTTMANKNYHPEEYWTEVGKRIEQRENGKNVIAGDDEPFYRYKRERFLELLHSVDFTGKKVLELGSGPGGNLLDISKKHQPTLLTGVDISAQMVSLAKKKLPKEVNVIKIDGAHIPFDDNYFDIVFTATVLQHNTDENMLNTIMAELARVSGDRVILFERIESTIKGDELCYGRPVSYYNEIMSSHGYELVKTKPINIRSSYYVSGAIRKGLNSSARKEGEPLNGVSVLLQNISLPFTKILDKIFTSKKDVHKLEFKKIRS